MKLEDLICEATEDKLFYLPGNAMFDSTDDTYSVSVMRTFEDPEDEPDGYVGISVIFKRNETVEFDTYGERISVEDVKLYKKEILKLVKTNRKIGKELKKFFAGGEPVDFTTMP